MRISYNNAMTTRRFHSDKKAGFTLIELLVVISIVSLLSSAVLSSLSGARESANTTRLVSDFKQFEKAFTLWMDANGRTQYPDETFFGSGNPSLKQAAGNTDLSEYLTSVPEPAFGNVYRYDNDEDTFSGCGDVENHGVNIFAYSVPDSIQREVNRIIEDDRKPNGKQDLDCGRIRTNSNNAFLYSLSNDGDM
jgi:prepilin-type N-terminal cleavage/methylation domain-containing protein